MQSKSYFPERTMQTESKLHFTNLFFKCNFVIKSLKLSNIDILLTRKKYIERNISNNGFDETNKLKEYINCYKMQIDSFDTQLNE